MLVTLKEILDEAKEKQYAVGAFNVTTLEGVQAVIQAAEELNSPVILQHAEVHENIIPLEEIGPIMLDFAKRAAVPVAVHLDHGASFDLCIKAIRLGFTSVMYDASAKDYETNIEETKELVKVAHAANVSVEAELGHIFTSEIGSAEGLEADSASDYENLDDIYTDPGLAKQFVEKTKVDCLAIAFGTVHGMYLKEPNLDLNRINEIKEMIDIPFVMHGGSGVSEKDYQQAIKNGVTKINYYTYMNKAGGNAIRESIKTIPDTEEIFMDDLSRVSREAMKQNAQEAIKIFLSTKRGE